MRDFFDKKGTRARFSLIVLQDQEQELSLQSLVRHGVH
jgi:hypothetical protein